jgi:hypothetical protein
MNVDGSRHISLIKTGAWIGLQADMRAETQDVRSRLARMFVSAFERAEDIDSWDF